MTLAERAGCLAPEPLLAIRSQIAAGVASGVWTTGWPRRDERIAGVRCLRFAPQGEVRGRVVHAHGGGFRMGAPEMMEHYAVTLARECEVEVICPAYRLAPEAPFPAGLNDCLAVVSAVAAWDDLPLIAAGDSAGGGLAASVALAERDRPLAALILHSPWLDLSVSRESYQTNAATDALFSLASAREAAASYLQGHPASDPLASPVLGEPRRFPRTLISVGTGEVLHDDARAMALRLETEGVEVELIEVAGMEHTAVVRGADLVGSAQVLAATQAFVRRTLTR